MGGQRIAQYDVLERLGGGGMGEVWKAHDPTLRRTVAIKVLKEPAAEGDLRILQEARAASALNHPHICTIYEVGQADGRSYIAMEYVEGRSLAELIPADGMPDESVIRYGTQIADAVAHAHTRGIVHRDLKTHNVVITPDGRAKVLDFGIADELPQGEAAELTRTLPSAPVEGRISGTLAYMAPEVLRGESSTPRSDIWALGVMLHAMVSGRTPFASDTAADLVASILKETVPPLPDRVSAGLRAITRRALSKEPARRYANAGELLAALEAIGSSSSVAAQAPHVPHVETESTSPSVAVLPFTDMSPERDQDYFCEGMADEIINALSSLRGLRVAARTSSFAFQGKSIEATEIGQRLKVGAVLEGSVRKAGNRLRITTQLINVADGFQLWSKRFDRDLDDVFAVQDEIARAIAEGLNVTLGIESGETLVQRPTLSMEAYNAHLRGRFLLNQKGAASRQALEHFERAVELDPDFALAHTGVADAYVYLGDQGMVPPVEAGRKARQALTRALELDPDQVDAHVVLGWMKMLYDWDWDAAERHFQKALEVGPNSPDAHSRYGCFMIWIRQRPEEAVALARKATELDPMDEVANTWLGCVLWFSGRTGEAIEVLRRAIDLNRTSFHANYHLGAALRAHGSSREAIEQLEVAMQYGGRHPWTLGVMGHAYLDMGDEAGAHACLEELVERSSEFSARGHLASLSAALGDMDRAFEYLEEAYELRDVYLTILKVLPEYESLRSDPRYDEMVRRVGLD